MTYIIVIALLTIALAGAVFVIYRQTKTLKLQKQVMSRRYELEMAAAIDDFEEKQASMEEQYDQERLHLQKQHDEEKDRLNGSIHELNEYIYELQSYSRNIGEVKTHQILHSLKKQWIKEGHVTESTMLIVPNVFVPYSSEYGLRTRKIAHIVLLESGLYLIQTKFWKGKIIHGLTKENAGEFAFLLDLINAKSYIEANEQTFSFTAHYSGDEQDGFTPSIQVKAHGELTKQITYTTHILDSFLTKKNGVKERFIKPVLFFGYQHNDYKTHGVIDLSDHEHVVRISSEKEFTSFLEEARQQPAVYSERDLQEIAYALEQIDYSHEQVTF